MLRRTVWQILLGIAGTIHAPAKAQADDVPPKSVDGTIKWVYSYETGKRMARESGKPLFVVFRCER